MPRLNDLSYLQQHELLRPSRGENQLGFALLSPSEQWDLFRYYLPRKAHPGQALPERRRQVTALDPSRPQRAGRAFHHWHRIEATLPASQAWVTKQPHSTSQKDRHIKVFSEVHPELDPKQSAEIIVELAKLAPPPNLCRDGPEHPRFGGP